MDESIDDLEKKRLINFRNEEGYTALHLSYKNPHPDSNECLGLLLAHFADPNIEQKKTVKRPSFLLQQAVKEKNSSRVKLLALYGAVDNFVFPRHEEHLKEIIQAAYEDGIKIKTLTEKGRSNRLVNRLVAIHYLWEASQLWRRYFLETDDKALKEHYLLNCYSLYIEIAGFALSMHKKVSVYLGSTFTSPINFSQLENPEALRNKSIEELEKVLSILHDIDNFAAEHQHPVKSSYNVFLGISLEKAIEKLNSLPLLKYKPSLESEEESFENDEDTAFDESEEVIEEEEEITEEKLRELQALQKKHARSVLRSEAFIYHSLACFSQRLPLKDCLLDKYDLNKGDPLVYLVGKVTLLIVNKLIPGTMQLQQTEEANQEKTDLETYYAKIDTLEDNAFVIMSALARNYFYRQVSELSIKGLVKFAQFCADRVNEFLKNRISNESKENISALFWQEEQHILEHHLQVCEKGIVEASDTAQMLAAIKGTPQRVDIDRKKLVNGGNGHLSTSPSFSSATSASEYLLNRTTDNSSKNTPTSSANPTAKPTPSFV